jgi:hypothetical protein
MDSRLSAKLLVVASIFYGIVIALLGYLGSSAVTIVAVIGALVLGALWAVRGVFLNRSS